MNDWKPWQLTSTELARQIENLEAQAAQSARASGMGESLRERLRELHAEADQRKTLAAGRLEMAASYYPDDAS